MLVLSKASLFITNSHNFKKRRTKSFLALPTLKAILRSLTNINMHSLILIVIAFILTASAINDPFDQSEAENAVPRPPVNSVNIGESLTAGVGAAAAAARDVIQDAKEKVNVHVNPSIKADSGNIGINNAQSQMVAAIDDIQPGYCVARDCYNCLRLESMVGGASFCAGACGDRKSVV